MKEFEFNTNNTVIEINQLMKRHKKTWEEAVQILLLTYLDNISSTLDTK